MTYMFNCFFCFWFVWYNKFFSLFSISSAFFIRTLACDVVARIFFISFISWNIFSLSRSKCRHFDKPWNHPGMKMECSCRLLHHLIRFNNTHFPHSSKSTASSVNWDVQLCLDPLSVDWFLLKLMVVYWFIRDKLLDDYCWLISFHYL